MKSLLIIFGYCLNMSFIKQLSIYSRKYVYGNHFNLDDFKSETVW